MKLEMVKQSNFNGMAMFEEWKEDCQRSYEMASTGKKKTRST
jgi:hypothetical protein